MRASTVEWTTPDPCPMLSGSVSILCTNFEFCEENNYRQFQKHTDLQSQAIFYDKKNNSKKSLHILEDGASGVQVGDIEQVIVKICLNHNIITLN